MDKKGQTSDSLNQRYLNWTRLEYKLKHILSEWFHVFAVISSKNVFDKQGILVHNKIKDTTSGELTFGAIVQLDVALSSLYDWHTGSNYTFKQNNKNTPIYCKLNMKSRLIVQ